MFFSELIETTRTAARPSADGIQIDTRPSPTVYNHVGISTNFEHASTSGSSEKGHLLILSPGLSGHTTATHLASHTGTTHSSEETLNSTPGMEVEESHQSPPMGLIIGSVLGGIFGIALITMAAIFVRKVHKSNMETLGCGIELVKTDKRTIDEDVALSQFLATGCADSRAREVGLKKLEQALKRKWAREKSALRSPGSVELEAFEKRKETERRLLLAASLDTLWTTRGEPSVRESQTG